MFLKKTDKQITHYMSNCKIISQTSYLKDNQSVEFARLGKLNYLEIVISKNVKPKSTLHANAFQLELSVDLPTLFFQNFHCKRKLIEYNVGWFPINLLMKFYFGIQRQWTPSSY